MSQGVGGKTRTRRKAGPAARTVVAIDLPSDVRLYVSPKGFWRLCGANRELRLERTAKGAIEAMPPAGSGTGAQNSRLAAQVGTGPGTMARAPPSIPRLDSPCRTAPSDPPMPPGSSTSAGTP